MTPAQTEKFLSHLIDTNAAFCASPLLPDGTWDMHEAEMQQRLMAKFVGSLIAEKDAEIARLKMQLESIKGVHAVGVESLRTLNPDPVVAMFQAASNLGIMAGQITDILNGEINETTEEAK